MTETLSDFRITKLDTMKKLVISFLSLIVMMVYPDINSLPIIGGYIIVLSGITVIKLSKNIFSFIVGVFLFWFNYSIVAANYYLQIDSFFLSDAYNPVSITGLRVLCLFITCILIFVDMNYVDNDSKFEFKADVSGNSVIALGYIIVLCFILIFGFTRPDVAGERGSPSTIYEYSIIIFIVGYYYFYNLKPYIITSSVLLLLFALQNLVYGGRVTALQELIIFFVLFIHKTIKINYKKIVPIAIGGFIIFAGVGMFRANFSLSLDTIKNILTSNNRRAFVLDTAYSAYYTSLTFIKTESILPFSERFKIFINWVFSQIIGGSFVGDSNVAIITRRYFMHYYGGVLPFFGHFHFGYIGVIMISMLVSKYINRLNKINSVSGIMKCILLYFVVTVPRWYLYSPSPLIRGAFLVCIFFFLTKKVNELLERKAK